MSWVFLASYAELDSWVISDGRAIFQLVGPNKTIVSLELVGANEMIVPFELVGQNETFKSI